MNGSPAPRNPEFEAVVRESFARQGLMAHLGAELASVEPGTVTIALPHRPELTQQVGLFHAGATASVLDSAAGYAALTLMPVGSEVLSVEFKINLLAPGLGDQLLARATVVRSGRSITVVRGDAFVRRDGAQTHCATMTATMIRVAS